MHEFLKWTFPILYKDVEKWNNNGFWAAPLGLNLNTSWRCAVSYTPSPLYPWYQMYVGLAPGLDAFERTISCSCKEPNRDSSAAHPKAQSFYRLHCSGFLIHPVLFITLCSYTSGTVHYIVFLYIQYCSLHCVLIHPVLFITLCSYTSSTVHYVVFSNSVRLKWTRQVANNAGNGHHVNRVINNC